MRVVNKLMADFGGMSTMKVSTKYNNKVSMFVRPSTIDHRLPPCTNTFVQHSCSVENIRFQSYLLFAELFYKDLSSLTMIQHCFISILTILMLPLLYQGLLQ